MHHVAFIIAGVCFVVTIILTVVVIFSYGMSDNPSQSSENMVPVAIGTFLFGSSVSALIGLSHFWHW
jgi:hypothetical protein